MTIERKVGMGIAGQPTGGAVNVADVFSTYLYTGTDATHVINNGIDLAGEGGLVWTKARHVSYGHRLVDSESTLSSNKYLMTDTTSGAYSGPLVSSFNSNGFTLPANWYANTADTTYGGDYASFTFRKAPKFFTCLTYTGNSSTDQTISHNLGSTPALIFIKKTSAAGDWYVYHTSLGNQKYGALQSNEAFSNTVSNLNWAVTDTTFNADDYLAANTNGATYVAYLFADNSAEDADDQMIKCGSYTGLGNHNEIFVDLGWEPQFLMIKESSGVGAWIIMDTMRGIVTSDSTSDDDAGLRANLDSPEAYVARASVNATGFSVSAGVNESGETYIYMAIRAPMMKEPESGTEVFSVQYDATSNLNASPATTFGSVKTDMIIVTAAESGGNRWVSDRLRGSKSLNATNTSAEGGGTFKFDEMLGVGVSGLMGGTPPVATHNFKRAKGFMDCVAFSGTGVAGREVSHSLSVIPEMMIVKSRTAGNQQWAVYHASLGATKALRLDYTNAAFTVSTRWNNTAPTTSNFTVGTSGAVNDATQNYISYLFASVAGVSKVGSFSHTRHTDTNVDCGFSNGARFILIKRTDSTGNWRMYDTVRGITAGADPELTLNTTAAEFTGGDYIHPYSSGFTAQGDNWDSGTYIFLAIA